MPRIKLSNPPFGGIAPREFEINVPGEGEIFRSTDPDNFGVFVRQGGQIRPITVSDEVSVAGQLGYGTSLNPADIKVHPFLSKELGRDVSSLAQFNLPDITQILGRESLSGQRISAKAALGFGTFGQQLPAPTEKITGPGAATFKDVITDRTAPALTALTGGKTDPFGPSSYTGVSIVDYLKSVDQISDFSSRAELAKQFGVVGNISEYKGTAQQNTQLLNTLRGGAGAGVGGVEDEIASRVGGGVGGIGGGVVSPQDNLINQLTGTGGLGAGVTGPSLETQRETLRQQRGITGEGGLGDIVGTFDEELGKFEDLLSDLDAQIRKGVTREEARLAPRELITGRQAELQAQASLDRGDILSAIESLQRGKERAESTLEREEADIMTILGLREKAQTQPLENLKNELAIRKSIRDLTKAEIPDVVSSQFNDQGDLTIITQDPNTGAFTTKTIPGIGKVSKQFENIRSETDNEGNLTIIGVDKNGNPSILGTFEGVGKTKDNDSLSDDEIRKALEDLDKGFLEKGLEIIGDFFKGK